MPSEAARVAVAIREETSAVMLTNAQLQMIANTSFVPAAFRGKVPEVLACVATGRALGLPDMTSLRGINIIEGKASLSAELMVAIVRSHGHSITGDVDDKKAIARGRRADNGDAMSAPFTIEMAQAAGLVGKSNWKKHPDDMMWARAVSKLCRRLFADCFAGATHVPEELEETADETMDEPPERFDSGELPLTEDEANLTPPVSTDSVSPLDLLIATYGREAVARAGSELFPGRSARALSPDELEQITDRLAEPPF